ncbi:MAG TPA: putative glycolipid-binding domain-containing protein [Jiangellales bacterium]|nr:putative glycolipid-binding domain-containing protein [Jiangellales bacterium]
MNRTLVWTARQWPGMEHTRLEATDSGVSVDGVIIAIVDGQPVRLGYRLECDPSWQPVLIEVTQADGPATSLRRSGERWYDGDGRERADLAGCRDVDIALTPLTNTIPIRRLSIDVGESAEIDVVYIDPGPPLDVRPQRQRYTRTSDGYRYASGSFQADLAVDADGIVVDYPGLWTLAAH